MTGVLETDEQPVCPEPSKTDSYVKHDAADTPGMVMLDNHRLPRPDTPEAFGLLAPGCNAPALLPGVGRPDFVQPRRGLWH